MEEYQDSVDFVNENPTEAAALMETYDIIKADVAEKAIPTAISYTSQEKKRKPLWKASTKYCWRPIPRVLVEPCPETTFILPIFNSIGLW